MSPIATPGSKYLCRGPRRDNKSRGSGSENSPIVAPGPGHAVELRCCPDWSSVWGFKSGRPSPGIYALLSKTRCPDSGHGSGHRAAHPVLKPRLIIHFKLPVCRAATTGHCVPLTL